jgi:hypothetical protein
MYKFTLLLYLKNFKETDYQNFNKKTFVFQKLMNVSENLIVISDESLKEIVQNVRISDKYTFINIKDVGNTLNLRTNFEFEIFLNSADLCQKTEYLIFFDESFLDLHLECLSENQIFKMLLDYSNTILSIKQFSSRNDFIKHEKIINEVLNIQEKDTYPIIQKNIFSGRLSIIKELKIIYKDFIDSKKELLKYENIFHLDLINNYNKYFTFLYNSRKFDTQKFTVYFIESYKIKHNEELNNFYLNLSFEQKKFNDEKEYF